MHIFSRLEYSSNKYNLLEHLQMQKGCKNNQITTVRLWKLQELDDTVVKT